MAEKSSEGREAVVNNVECSDPEAANFLAGKTQLTSLRQVSHQDNGSHLSAPQLTPHLFQQGLYLLDTATGLSQTLVSSRFLFYAQDLGQNKVCQGFLGFSLQCFYTVTTTQPSEAIL